MKSKSMIHSYIKQLWLSKKKNCVVGTFLLELTSTNG